MGRIKGEFLGNGNHITTNPYLQGIRTELHYLQNVKMCTSTFHLSEG